MIDAAGNYIFNVESDEVSQTDRNEYRIMKMNFFEQREFLSVIKNVFIEIIDETGEVRQEMDFFTPDFNNSQDYLLPKIYVKTSSNKWMPLSPDNLPKLFDMMPEFTPINLINNIFVSAVGSLLENFTGTAVTRTRQTSSQDAEEKSEAVNIASQLSKT